MPVTIGIHKKQLLFWAIIGLVFFGGRGLVNGLKSSADVNQFIQPTEQGGFFKANFIVHKNGSVTLDGKKISTRVTSLSNTDQLRIILIDKAKEAVSHSETTITLPNDIVASELHITPRLVHNLTTNVDLTYPNAHVIVAKTPYINGDATLSLEIDFPKGELAFPLATRIVDNILGFSLIGWVLIGSVLPAFSLIILIFLLQRNRKMRNIKGNKDNISTPPSNLAPAVVEVLINGHVSSHSIAATLIDLARRGYIIIGYNDNDFNFGKHKTFALPPENLQSKDIPGILRSVAQTKDSTDIKLFERLILSKIFTSEGMIIDKQELEMRIGHRLFSEKIAVTYTEIYKEATKAGFFIEDPSTYHHQFKLIGLIMFYLGFFGFIFGSFFFPNPKTALLGWVGMLITSYIIIRISPKLPILSDRGLIEYQKWAQFRNYLRDPKPLFYNDNTRRQFEKYLPYAIALGIEREWSARFREHPVTLPDWFVSPRNNPTLENFSGELFPLISWVSKNLSFARTPIID